MEEYIDDPVPAGCAPIVDADPGASVTFLADPYDDGREHEGMWPHFTRTVVIGKSKRAYCQWCTGFNEEMVKAFMRGRYPEADEMRIMRQGNRLVVACITFAKT